LLETISVQAVAPDGSIDTILPSAKKCSIFKGRAFVLYQTLPCSIKTYSFFLLL
jgi:hypothetical protein